MIRRPPRSTPLYSSAASDVYKRQSMRSVQLLEIAVLELLGHDRLDKNVLFHPNAGCHRFYCSSSRPPSACSSFMLSIWTVALLPVLAEAALMMVRIA